MAFFTSHVAGTRGRICRSVATAFGLALTMPGPITAEESWPPDHDGNGFNNFFERAIDLGELRPAGVNISEQLGGVPWGFDTKDFYKFMFPGGVGDLQLSVRLDEKPNGTMYINVYDQNRNNIWPSIGQNNETFKIPLTSGLYYIEVLTDPGAAKGRNLRYTLSAKPMEIPLPEKGGLACRGAPNLGVINAQGREIEGNLSSDKPTSIYGFHVPYGSALTGGMLGLEPSRKYQISIIDRLSGDKIQFRDSALKEESLLLDPGFYCLKLESVGSAGFGNYRGRFTALNAGLVPGTTKDRAQNIIDMELGNFSMNGRYGLVSRYFHYKKKPGEIPNVPTVVQHGHQYVIRDWVGLSARTQYYWFNLPARSRIQMRLTNQMASARLFIEDREGNVLASSIVDSSNSNPGLLPSQSLFTTLPSGKTYYLRIEYISSSNPGTSFGVALETSPPK